MLMEGLAYIKRLDGSRSAPTSTLRSQEPYLIPPRLTYRLFFGHSYRSALGTPHLANLSQGPEQVAGFREGRDVHWPTVEIWDIQEATASTLA